MSGISPRTPSLKREQHTLCHTGNIRAVFFHVVINPSFSVVTWIAIQWSNMKVKGAARLPKNLSIDLPKFEACQVLRCDTATCAGQNCEVRHKAGRVSGDLWGGRGGGEGGVRVAGSLAQPRVPPSQPARRKQSVANQTDPDHRC